MPGIAQRLEGPVPRGTVAAVFIAISAACCLTSARPDTYWHLRAGQDIVASGRVSLVDHYSFTARGLPWPDHEWLWQLITYVAHAAGGMPLLTALAAALGVATMTVLLDVVQGPPKVRLLLLAAAFLVSGAPGTVRPQLFTNLALMATLWLVVHERWWALPPLFLTWANLHGAVVLGALVLAPACATAVVSGARGRLRALAACGLCAAALFATPLGARLPAFIVESTTRSRLDRVSEWQPALFLGLRPVLLWVTSAALLGLTARGWRRLPRPDRTVVAAALLAIPLAFQAVRNVGPFALLAAPAASRLLTAVRPRVPAPPPSSTARAPLVALAATAAALMAFLWSRPPPFLQWDPVPATAAAAIRACPGNVFNEYDDGGSLIWFVPEKPVFFDGRQDPYPLDFLKQVQQIATNAPLRRALFARYQIECAAIRPSSSIGARLEAEGWQARFRDRRWLVLAAP
jgi:hypothetical protein